MNTIDRWLISCTSRGAKVIPNPDFIEPSYAPDQRSQDGRKTVIFHGKRITTHSPRVSWPGSELWGVGRCQTFYWHSALKDWTRWFDLHPVERSSYHKGIKVLRAPAWAWYCQQDSSRPIYLLEPHPECPASVAFPRQWVQEILQTTRFTVSVDWMFGLAICEGFQRIVLNGIGTRFETDYQFAHQGILYWIGYARGRGIDVVIDHPSCYADPEKVYGYEVGAPAWVDTPVPALV